MTLDIDLAEAERFLKLLDPQATFFTFQTIDDARLPTGRPRDLKDRLSTVHCPLREKLDWLIRLNLKFEAAIYVCVNATDGKGRTAANIVVIRAVWADLDKGLPKTWVLHPSIITETSPGRFQAFWLLHPGMSQADHLGVLRNLSMAYGSDPGVNTVERVMRVPGFYHRKGAPFRVRIVEASGRRCTIEEMTEAHEPVKAPKQAAQLPATIEDTTRNSTLIVAAGRLRRAGLTVDELEPALLAMNAARCTPPLDDKEVLKIARSIGKYPMGTLVKEGDIKWPEVTKDDVPFPKSAGNVAAYLAHLGAIVWANEFDCRCYIDGFGDYDDLGDDALRRLRILAESYNFRVPRDAFEDYVIDLALQDTRHPVREYLISLRWDGTPRVRRWLHTYVGAWGDDPRYIEDVATLVLVAAVQRVRNPGCKFDCMVVLEGPEDIGKSTVWRIMASDQWFSDSLLVGAETKVVIEQTGGKWIIEHAELDGMQQRDVERIKSFISRQEDTARLSYRRNAGTVPRQCIFVGTTNNADYLRSETGNRRFLPIRCGRIDLAGLYRDRDQLWAEAVHLADQAIKTRTLRLDLPTETKPLAIAAQEARRIVTDTEDRLQTMLSQIWFGYITTADLLTAAGVTRTDERNRMVASVGKIMSQLGWTKHKRRDKGAPRWGYWIGTPTALLHVFNPATGEFIVDPEHPAAQYLNGSLSGHG